MRLWDNWWKLVSTHVQLLQHKSCELTRFSISLAFSCCASFSIFSISSILWASDPQALQHTEETSVWWHVYDKAWGEKSKQTCLETKHWSLKEETETKVSSWAAVNWVFELLASTWGGWHGNRWSRHVTKHVVTGTKCSDPSPGRWGRLACSHGNSARLSPFRGTGGVAGGDAGLHAVWALQAQGVICLVATRWRLMVQDRVMNCWRQICEGRERADSCHRSTVPSTDTNKTLQADDYDQIQNMLNKAELTQTLPIDNKEKEGLVSPPAADEMTTSSSVDIKYITQIKQDWGTHTPLFCSTNCLLGSMSNGFDISLSSNCNP